MDDKAFSTFRHDVRNHLNTISVNTQLIKMLIENHSLPEQVNKSLDIIIEECKACADTLTVNDSEQDN